MTRRRTALALYSLLLVLPTVVLGGLHWYRLVSEQVQELEEVPRAAEDAARRLADALGERVRSLLEAEDERPFTEYREFIVPEDLIGTEVAFVPSRLVKEPLPEGILCWFTYDLGDDLEGEAPAAIFGGDHTASEAWAALSAGYARSVEGLVRHDRLDSMRKRITRYSSLDSVVVPISQAVIHLSRERDINCLRTEMPALRRFDDEFVRVDRYDFHVRFYRDERGTPQVVATRLMMVDPNPALRGMPDCFSNLAGGATIFQGFLIDPRWLFEDLPRELAQSLLRAPEQLITGEVPLSSDGELVTALIRPVEELGMEVYDPKDLDYGGLWIATSTREVLARHAQQRRRFGGVAFMLLLSLGTGMALLLRSVREELEQARRTENFVAAVTHELRTPLAAIRLYGEMLRDGWATTPEKQDEYYGRIVAEVHRLEAMVERVLEKSRVTSQGARPEPGDANAFLRDLVEREFAGAKDLALELDPELPEVLMTREGLRSVAVNLIENARKYAPVAPGGEPILVRTRVVDGAPLLEVLDRGPGVPDEDKQNVFEAFYRRGDESTRKRRGTGLGLHLVKIQSQAMGGDVEVLDREGGGSLFRVSLRPPGRDSGG